MLSRLCEKKNKNVWESVLLYVFSLYICILMYNRFSMKRFFGILLVGMAVMLSSCEDMLKSLNVTEEISMPNMDFRLNRQQQKDGLGDILMDEYFTLNLDSMLVELGYSAEDVDKCLKSMALKVVNFSLKDTSYVKNFDFLDSARMTFSTKSVSEATVALLTPKEERKATSQMNLQISLEDVTKFIRSKEQVRVRIYGKADLSSLPEEVSYVDILVGGMMRMELKPL